MTLLAVAGFALLFAMTALWPLRGEEGGCDHRTGCGGAQNCGSCGSGRCELEERR